MDLMLKFRVTWNLLNASWRLESFHLSTPDVLATLNWIEDTIPTTLRVKAQEVQHKPRIVPAPT
jgi:hypothetical protein